VSRAPVSLYRKEEKRRELPARKRAVDLAFGCNEGMVSLVDAPSESW